MGEKRHPGITMHNLSFGGGFVGLLLPPAAPSSLFWGFRLSGISLLSHSRLGWE
jgi:hypothetical protein